MLEPPTAVQVDGLMQLTDRRVVVPAGAPKSLQVVPPFVVPMTCVPTATHAASLEHEMPSSVTPAGAV
jgi:hypothetical protein